MQPQANYNFIFDEQKKQKRSLMPSGGSKTSRIIIFAVGILVLLIGIIVFFSILSSSGKSSTQALVSLAQEQTEIIRVATNASGKARDTNARNLAITTQLAVESSQQDTIALLAKQGHKLSPKDLSLKRSAKTDSDLEAANNTNSYDPAFIKIMNAELITYQTHLKTAYDSSKSKSEKSILATAYNGVTQILKSQPVQPSS